jgi:hypothetical protein
MSQHLLATPEMPSRRATTIFKAKAAIDTFVVRVGDALTALWVWLGARLGAGARAFAITDMVQVGVWMALAWAVGRLFKLLTAAAGLERPLR